jgi:hypothetical protein
MSRVNWIQNKSLKPSAVFDHLLSLFPSQDSSSYDRNVAEIEVASWVLLNMMHWPTSIDTNARFELTRKAVQICIKSREFSKSGFIEVVNAALKEYSTGVRPEQFTVLASLSLHPSFSVKTLQVGNTKIRFLPGGFPRKFLRQRDSAMIKPESVEWGGYKKITAETTARYPMQGLSVVMRDLNTIRAMLCIRANSGHLAFGSSMNGPLNKIRFGGGCSLHNDSSCWEVKFNHQQIPVQLYRFHTVGSDRKIIDAARKHHADYFKLLFEHQYRDVLQSSLVSYVNALDERDQNNALIRLWSTMETLCGDADSIVLQCSGLYPDDYKYIRQVLECIRGYRNSCIHQSTRSDRAFMLCLQLQNIFRHLFEFHLFDGLDNLEDTRSLLSLPADIGKLKSKKEMIDRKLRLIVLGGC